MKLTKRVIDQAPCDGKKPHYLWDSQLIGFGVKILPSGSKRYLVKYRNYGGGRAAKARWLLFGTHGQMPLEQAREHARQVLAAVARGEDPQGERLALREAPKLQEAWDRFAEEHLIKKKSATVRDYTAAWRNEIAPRLGNMKIRDITRQDIDKLHKTISKRAPISANRVLAVLSKLMNRAEAWDWREQGSNPCRHIERNSETKRDRYLSTDELQRLGAALHDLVDLGIIWPDVANLVRLLLLTGARKNEIAQCKWSWVELDSHKICLPDSKTGAKSLFLSDGAIQVLRDQRITSRDPSSEYVFPGGKQGAPIVNLYKPWGLICDECNLAKVRIHDLRHTAASIAVGQGIALPIIGKLLGHSQAQTTARYAHVGNDPALAAANAVGTALGASIM